MNPKEYPELFLVTGKCDKDGKKIGMFGDTELGWHSNGNSRHLIDKILISFYCITEDYINSYFEEIITQLKTPASRIRITKLAAGKMIPWHVDYDVSYGVRCIIPIYGGDNVVNLFKRDGKIEAYNLKDGRANFLNIGYKHAVVNMSNSPRIALMFTLNGTKDIEKLFY